MAGRKHHLQQFGRPMNDFNKIQDPFERDLAFKSMTATPYCKHCGEQILDALMDKNKGNVDWEWEMKHQAHYRCYKEWEAEASAKIEAERRRLAKEAKEMDWDDYMAQMMKQREE